MAPAALDVLAFAAHPDDLEITIGGTLIKLSSSGRKVGACDLTRGEMGTYGSPETRRREAAEAAKRMGLALRLNAGLPDSGLFNVREQQSAVVDILRQARPEIVILPGHDQRHPDHSACPRIVFDACYFAGLKRFGSGRPHRPRKILYAHTSYAPHPPGFVVDISREIARKIRTVAAYASQFPRRPGSRGLSNLGDLEGRIRDRGRTYGSMIGRPYGEGFYQREMLEVDDLSSLPGRSI